MYQIVANPSRNNYRTFIRIEIPQSLHQVPIISQLITAYGLTVNIRAAVLDKKATGGGWFDLTLEGDRDHIHTAVDYLTHIGVKIWNANLFDDVF